MADTQMYYESTLTGEELDAALQKIPQVEELAQNAAQSAELARSWAEGGTGVRPEEDLNSARYWCQQAQTITQGALGWYADADQLKAVYPTGTNGQWAIIGRTDTIWTWDSDSGAWVDTGAQIDLSNYYTKPQAEARFQMPVGFLFEWLPVAGQQTDLSTPEKVAAYFGYGTWQEITGRFTFGRDDTHAAGETGGEEMHTLTGSEVPNLHNVVYGTAGGSNAVLLASAVTLNGTYANSIGLPMNNGGGQPHNNMPPYLTVYKWQRIA